MNVAATDIVVAGSAAPALLGMDHRAIVWCFNLLLPLRKIIFSMHNSDPENAKRRVRDVSEQLAIPDDYSYLDSVNRERELYIVSDKAVSSWMHYLICTSQPFGFSIGLVRLVAVSLG